MKKILGLDLGTNSIGWAVVESTKEINRIGGYGELAEHYKLKEQGVLIFKEGIKTEKGVESSRAAERTGFRSARRIKFRRKLRKYETLKILIDHQMCPLSKEELEQWRQSIDPETSRKKSFHDYPSSIAFRAWLHTDNTGDSEKNKEQIRNPYYLRARGLDERLNKYELGRVFYHFAQRRGFLSNRLDNTEIDELEIMLPDILELLEESDNAAIWVQRIEEYKSQFDLDEVIYKKAKSLFRALEKIQKENKASSWNEINILLKTRIERKENLGKVKEGIADLTDDIREGNWRTMGEYFYDCFKKGIPIRGRYTAREEHYKAEFEILCEAQHLSGIDKTKKQPKERYTGICKLLYKAIFYQRPLRSQKGQVGKCTMEPSKSRCQVSHPEYEEFIMLQFLNNVKVKSPQDENFRMLNEKEYGLAKQKFFRRGNNFSFEDIAKSIAPKGQYSYVKSKFKKEGDWLFNYHMDHTVAGCPMMGVIQKIWGCHFAELKVSKGDVLSLTKGYYNAQDIWHVLTSFEDNEMLLNFAKNKLNLNEREVKYFARTTLRSEYGSLSLKAIRKIVPFLKQGSIYSHAVFMAKLPELIDKDKWNDSRELLSNEIRLLIDNDRESRKKIGLINGLLRQYKIEHNDHHKDYVLDNQDRKAVRQALIDVYGENRLERIGVEAKSILTKELEVSYESVIKTGNFIPNLRLDERIISFIEDNNLCTDIEDAKNHLYHPSSIDQYPEATRKEDGRRYLGSPITSSMRNPMAMRSLHQLRKLINTLIKEDKIDEYTHVHIELARELNDSNKRKAIRKHQKAQEERKNTNIENIRKLYFEECGENPAVNSQDIIRFQLWEEQNHKCLYTGKTIPLSGFIGENPDFDIEHTLPRGDSEDNSMENKTLCEKKYNREIKKNRIPFECPNYDEIVPRMQGWKKEIERLENEIKKLKRQSKGASTKDQKDRVIVKRHVKQLEHDYLKGKYERFMMKELTSGFKNSQKVDIGIISKLSRAYMKSLFPRVNSVKGSMVDQFRKAWGLHEFQKDELGRIVKDGYDRGVYAPKNRNNHVHHCQDAVVIACMGKQAYDSMAHAWRLLDQDAIQEAQKQLEESKPWHTFTQDVRDLKDKVLIVHHSPDHVGKPAKKKWRKRGKIQLNSAGEEIFLSGDVVRGSLHKPNFYGKIQVPKSSSVSLGNDEGEIISVFRNGLDKLKATDIKNIIDPVVRKKIERAKKEGVIKFSTNPTQSNKLSGPIWMNEEKGIEIKKVRYAARSQKNTFSLKKNSHPSTHDYRKYSQVMNDENHACVIYEEINGGAKQKRNNIIFDLFNYSSIKNIPNLNHGLVRRDFLTKGVHVLFYKTDKEELKSLSHEELVKRNYLLAKMDKQNRLFFRHQSNAKPTSEMVTKYKIDLSSPLDQIRLTKDGWNFIVEGNGFEISKSGSVSFQF